VHSARTLALVLPLSLGVIFLILYLQFRRVSTTSLVFSSILVAWSGGFILLWLYGKQWFSGVSLFGADIRELFQMHPVNLSVAIWVGFLALFGIASDDAVLICTYLEQRFRGKALTRVSDVRRLTVEAASRRVRPAMMTTATTVLALLPVLTSQGRGADVMAPMAIPSFGGMVIEMLTILTTPTLYCWLRERSMRKGKTSLEQSSRI
jgi:Cu(I)/Ag(I) efflux system membrane protein CusA/SilA